MYRIMNTSNSHNEKLVEQINAIYDGDLNTKVNFYVILKALMYRDREEMIDKEIVTEDEFYFSHHDYHGLYNKLVRNYTYEYLMHVADDADLETIINFCR